MKSTPAILLALAALGSGSCSLVTVPVKVAGGIVETTVETTGKVIAAPFNAVGGREDSEKKEKSAAKKEEPTPPTEPKE
jgi:hypothetical protein